jgi:hypothetical protein
VKEIKRGQTNERVSPISPSIGYGEEGKREGERKENCDACVYRDLKCSLCVRDCSALHPPGLALLQPVQRPSNIPPWPKLNEKCTAKHRSDGGHSGGKVPPVNR